MSNDPHRKRQRLRGDGPRCPICGSDMFCYRSIRVRDRRYPGFIRSGPRVRYYRCGDPACAGRLKRVRD